MRIRSGRPRDSQRRKLYGAEGVIHGREFVSVQEMQEYVNRLTRQQWFRKRWPWIASRSRVGIRVKDGRGRIRAGGSFAGQWVTMPRWARYEAILLHEVAHVVTLTKFAPHGREYAANYLALVQHCMGKGAADRLRASFRANRVRYKPKRELTPEALERLRERGRMLAAAKHRQ